MLAAGRDVLHAESCEWVHSGEPVVDHPSAELPARLEVVVARLHAAFLLPQTPLMLFHRRRRDVCQFGCPYGCESSLGAGGDGVGVFFGDAAGEE